MREGQTLVVHLVQDVAHLLHALAGPAVVRLRHRLDSTVAAGLEAGLVRATDEVLAVAEEALLTLGSHRFLEPHLGVDFRLAGRGHIRGGDDTRLAVEVGSTVRLHQVIDGHTLAVHHRGVA